jgi:hypothetical protein
LLRGFHGHGQASKSSRGSTSAVARRRRPPLPRSTPAQRRGSASVTSALLYFATSSGSAGMIAALHTLNRLAVLTGSPLDGQGTAASTSAIPVGFLAS